MIVRLRRRAVAMLGSPVRQEKRSMVSASFDFTPLLAPSLPAPADKWTGFPKYNFIGGNNDADHVPVDGLIAAGTTALKRGGATLASYGLQSGPPGYCPCRGILAAKTKRTPRLSRPPHTNP